MKNDNNTHEAILKKSIALAVIAIALALIALFIIGTLTACGSASDEAAIEASDTPKATVTAGEAAEKAGQEKAANGQSATQQNKTGTEDGAIDAVREAAYKDIEGFDGKWTNFEIDVDDVITTIDFDWQGNHYQYRYDQEKQILMK